jgi:hypothetical protein
MCGELSGPRRDNTYCLIWTQSRVTEAGVLDANLVELGGVEDTFGHGIRRGFQVQATGRTSCVANCSLEVLHLAHDCLEKSSLEAIRCDDGVAMHRIGEPDDGMPLLANPPYQIRQPIRDRSRAHPDDQR